MVVKCRYVVSLYHFELGKRTRAVLGLSYVAWWKVLWYSECSRVEFWCQMCRRGTQAWRPEVRSSFVGPLWHSGTLSVLRWRGRCAWCRWYSTTSPREKLLKLSAGVAVHPPLPHGKDDTLWTIPGRIMCPQTLLICTSIVTAKWRAQTLSNGSNSVHLCRLSLLMSLRQVGLESGSATTAESFSNFQWGKVVKNQRHRAERPLQLSTLKAPDCRNKYPKMCTYVHKVMTQCLNNRCRVKIQPWDTSQQCMQPACM